MVSVCSATGLGNGIGTSATGSWPRTSHWHIRWPLARSGQIEVNVIRMVGVRSRSKHRLEALTRRILQSLAKRLWGGFLGQVDHRAVAESDRTEINCIPTTVL